MYPVKSMRLHIVPTGQADSFFISHLGRAELRYYGADRYSFLWWNDYCHADGVCGAGVVLLGGGAADEKLNIWLHLTGQFNVPHVLPTGNLNGICKNKRW